MVEAKSFCEDGWTPYKQEKCIKIRTDTLVSQNEGELLCGNFKSSLLKIHSEEEQRFLDQLLRNQSLGILGNLWIGLEGRRRSQNDIGTKSAEEFESFEFKWNDGSALDFTNWGDEENTKSLNDKMVGIDDSGKVCVQLGRKGVSSSGSVTHWSIVQCSTMNFVVCEKKELTLSEIHSTLQNLQEEVRQKYVTTTTTTTPRPGEQ